MGTWSNHPFVLVLIFDILLLHFGNICCTLPTAHPERLAGDGDFVIFSNKNPDKNQNSHITSKGCLFIPWMSSFHLVDNIRSTDEFGKVLRLKLHLRGPNNIKIPRKIVVLASLQPSPPSQKNVKKPMEIFTPILEAVSRDSVFRCSAVGFLRWEN